MRQPLLLSRLELLKLNRRYALPVRHLCIAHPWSHNHHCMSKLEAFIFHW